MTVTWFGDSLIDRIKKAAMTGVIAATKEVQTEAVSLVLDTPKTGRVYELYHPRRTHQASAPGEPFANDIGTTLQTGRTEFDPNDLSGEAIWGGVAEYLEYGTAKMAPRSFARPALANKKDQVKEIINSEIAAVLK